MAETQTKEESIIDVRRATQSAIKYFQSLFPQISEFSLEEVELSEDGKHWLITLGFKAPPARTSTTIELLTKPPQTKFKVFKVDAKTGKVLSMKIRSLG